MPSPSLTAQTAPTYFYQRGVDIVADTYDEDALLFPLFTDAIDRGEIKDFPYGGRGSGLVIDATPKERAPAEQGQQAYADNANTWQMKVFNMERTFAITDEDLEAESISQTIRLFDRFIRTYSRHAGVWKDQHVAGVFQKGTLTAGSLHYFDNSYKGTTDPNAGFVLDGLPFFDTAHTLAGSSSTYSNIDPTLALSATNIDTVYTRLSATNAIDDAGKQVMGDATHVMVPTGLRGDLNRILNAQLLPGSANNDANPVRSLNLQPLVNRYLTDDTDAWWMLDASQGSGVIVYDSGEPEIRQWYDVATKTTMIGADFRFGVAVRDPRRAYSCNKAAS